MLKRNEGESLSSASASSVSSQIQSDASEQTDTPVTDLQALSSDSEVEIANAAFKLTADVPWHDDTDPDYHSESDVDDNIFFWNLVIRLWPCLIEIEINACREFWLKTENKYFWTDFNVNVWLINVTQICPRMLKNTSQSVSNLNFFCRSIPLEPPRGACCYASTIHFSRLLSSDQTPIIFSNHNHGREPCKEYWYSLKRLKSKSRWGNEKIIPSKEKRREEAFESLSTKKTRNFL